MGQAGNAEIRISDAERDEAISILGTHLSTGRLELAEYEERCGRAVAARTRGELEVLFTDLPAPHPDLSSAAPPTQLIQRAGKMVSDPTGARRKKDLEPTRASAVLEFVAGMSLILGVPAAILLTVMQGMWWLFIVVAVVIVVAGGASEAAKNPKST